MEFAADSKSEWRAYLPDGREVIVRRSGAHWLVRCGDSLAHSHNLDVALMRVVRADPEVIGHVRNPDYPTWIRGVANMLDP